MALPIIDLFMELRELFPAQPLAKVKQAAVFYKNDNASYRVFLQNCAGQPGCFPEFPDRTDLDLENYLQSQLQFLKEVLPDADPAFITETFFYVGTANMETAILEATLHNSYPKNFVFKKKEEGTKFDVQLFLKFVPNPLVSFSHSNYIMTEKMMTEAVDYLLKHSSEDKRALITSFVKETRSLNLSYRKMRDVGILKQPCTNVKTPQLKTFDKSPDYGQVFEKLFIENESAILACLNAKRVEEEMKENSRECSICLRLSTTIIKICSDGHEMCDQCVKEYTELLYHAQGELFFHCAFENCSLLLPNAVVRSVWDTSRYSKLLEDRINAAPTADNQLVTCPFCSFRNQQPNNTEICCYHCSKKFCVTCRMVGHLPLACHQRENDLCKLVEEKMSETLIRKCPVCRRQFTKLSNYCNKVRCDCGVFICYVCRKVLENEGHGHFYAQGRMPSDAPGCCPLYSDINSLHVTSVIQAGRKMLQTIKSENPNVELPYDPLAVLPKPQESDAVPYQF